jgi:signal transduction histidine kinase
MALPFHAKTRRRLALLFTAPLAFSLVFFIVNTQAENTDIEILSAQNLRSALSSLLALTQDAEASERGFFLTGDERFLLPYQQAKLQLKTQIELCRNILTDHPEFREPVEHLIHLLRYKFDQVEKALELQKTSGFAAGLQYLKSGADQDTMDEIRRAVDSLQLQVGSALNTVHEHQRNINRGLFWFFLISTAVSIVVLISLYHTLIDYIHGREAAQAQLAALNADLERRIGERTQELQDVNAELRQFAYVASHDLQEPLRTVTSFTQLLSARYRGKLDADADEFIDYIVTSTRRMSDLIHGLLALVRLRKEGQLTAPVSLDRLLEDAEINLQASIRESGACIEHTPLPSLAVNEVQITQLFQNLLSNAIKYRQELVPPVITVAANRDGVEWVFSVQDNGRGFDPRHAESIFGLYQRLPSRDVDGTGMGLSISKKIVERHGGRIWAESEIGSGSTFYFSLPIALETGRSNRSETIALTSAS